jgi:formamidopyrimidine-DNA glycosylase
VAEGDTILRAARRIEEAIGGRAVYRRSGQACPVCGTPILARGQGDANRTTYWCPNCQPAPSGN